jgi:N-formylglutamate amidohydrolase
MTQAAYRLFEPEKRTSCVVFASPHSGRSYFDSFKTASILDDVTIRSSEDAFVDQLFESAQTFGAPFLVATAPRAYLDLNRSPEELDPALIEGISRSRQNPRVASGLGVIPRVVANGRSIYRGKLPHSEAMRRISSFWRPYHARLQSVLDDSRRMFGQTVLIDCHSMPREALDGLTQSSGRRPHIVLGDRFGAAAHGEIMDHVESAFASAGFDVVRNTPFAGAYVTQTYGRPSRRQHAIQVEIDRSLYMDEHLIRPNANFDQFRGQMRQVVAKLTEIGKQKQSLAAE